MTEPDCSQILCDLILGGLTLLLCACQLLMASCLVSSAWDSGLLEHRRCSWSSCVGDRLCARVVPRQRGGITASVARRVEKRGSVDQFERSTERRECERSISLRRALSEAQESQTNLHLHTEGDDGRHDAGPGQAGAFWWQLPKPRVQFKLPCSRNTRRQLPEVLPRMIRNS